MKVLITGGAGYVGQALLRALGGNHQARVLDLRPSAIPAESVVGDITDYATVEEAVRGMDAVAHLAVVAEEDDPMNVLDVCIKGLANVLEACVRQGVGRVVAASSINAMGYGGLQHSVPPPLYVPVDEDHPCRPDSMLNVCKLMSEQLCARYTRRYGLSTVCLRLSRIGDAERPTLYPGAVSPEDTSLLREVLWSAVNVADAARAFRMALEATGLAHQVFIITSDTAFARRPSLELLREHFPATAAIRNVDAYARDPYKSLFSNDRAKRVLGWRPQVEYRP